MTVLGSGSPVTIGPPVVLASFMEHWVLSQGLVTHLAPLIFPASYFGVIHEAPTVCLPVTIKTKNILNEIIVIYQYSPSSIIKG